MVTKSYYKISELCILVTYVVIGSNSKYKFEEGISLLLLHLQSLLSTLRPYFVKSEQVTTQK